MSLSEHSYINDALSACASADAPVSGPSKYKRLTWSRVLIVKGFMIEQDRAHSVDEDLKQYFLDDAEADDGDQIPATQPYFDPKSFDQQHKPLLLDDYRLNRDELNEWA